MSRKRVLVYALVALPLIAGAVALRLTHQSKTEKPVASFQDTSGSRAYIDKVEGACAAYTKAYAADHGPHARQLVAALARITPGPGYDSLHERLIKALEGAREPEAALEFTGIAAFLDAIDCVNAPHSHPDMAYPAAPIRDGRTRLGWPAFLAAIDGICADNSNRTVLAARLIGQNREFSDLQKNFAQFQLRSVSYRRLVRLFARLGQPPDYTRPYREWMTVVEARSRAVVAQALAQNVAQTRRLDARIDELDAEENWFGRAMGLRVCSSNGPAAPPPNA